MKIKRLTALLAVAIMVSGVLQNPVSAFETNSPEEAVFTEDNTDFWSANEPNTAWTENAILESNDENTQAGQSTESAGNQNAVNNSANGENVLEVPAQFDETSPLSEDNSQTFEDPGAFDEAANGKNEDFGEADGMSGGSDEASDQTDELIDENKETSGDVIEEVDQNEANQEQVNQEDTVQNQDGQNEEQIQYTEEFTGNGWNDDKETGVQDPETWNESSNDPGEFNEDRSFNDQLLDNKDNEKNAGSGEEEQNQKPVTTGETEENGTGKDKYIINTDNSFEVASENSKAADYEEEMIKTIEFEESSIELVAGEERDIWLVTDYNYDVYDYTGYEKIQTVKVSDTSIAGVATYTEDDFMLVGKKPGNTKVTVVGTNGSCRDIDVRVTSFLEKGKVSVNAEHQTVIGIIPVYDEIVGDYSYLSYSASSSDKSIATASIKTVWDDNRWDYYEEELVIKGVKPGNAVITVKSGQGISTITVEVKAPSFKLGKESVSVVAKKSCTINSTGSKISTVKSSNTKIVTVSKIDNDSFEIKAVALGKTTVTAQNAFGTTAKITVTVTKPIFTLNKTSISLNGANNYTLKVTGSTISKVSSSNNKILTVKKTGSNTALIKPVKPGTAYVTITDPYGTSKKATVKVTSFLRVAKLTLTAGNTKTYFFDDLYKIYEAYFPENRMTSSNNKTASAKADTVYNCIDFIGKYPGKATIYIRCKATGAVSPIVVTVKAPSFKLSSSKVKVDKNKAYAVTSTGSDIGKVSSSNTKVLVVKKSGKRKIILTPVKPGTVKVNLTSVYGVKRTVSVSVTKNYFKNLLTEKTKAESLSYGATVIKGKTAPSATLAVSVQGKTFNAKADKKGTYSISGIPVVKIGTRVKITYKLQGQAISKTIVVGKGQSSVYTPKYTYLDTKQVLVELENVHIGDQLRIGIDGKVYKRAFKKSYKKITVSVPINKPKNYGKKMVVKLVNKYNQELAIYYDYVYISYLVYVGDSKGKVRWLTGWNDPESKTYTEDGETWYYDWNGDDITDAALYFDNNGKVTGWWIEEDS